jgi:hypothetical protein
VGLPCLLDREVGEAICVQEHILHRVPERGKHVSVNAGPSGPRTNPQAALTVLE